jgi:hypothetical protein
MVIIKPALSESTIRGKKYIPSLTSEWDRLLTRANCLAHILRMKVVLVSTTATVHELLTFIVLRVVVPAWGFSLAGPNFHGFEAHISCSHHENI